MSLSVVRHRRIAALAAGLAALAAVAVSPIVSPASAAPRPSCAAAALTTPSRVGAITGIARARVVDPSKAASTCASGSTTSGEIGEYNTGGQPPLLFHGGKVMSTSSDHSKVVLTPIFWAPSGYSFTSTYKSVITTYLSDLAADSGKLSNVFGTTYEYAGSNGSINYGMQLGSTIDDTQAFPTAGCTTNTGGVYGDGSGYTTCLDDDQAIAEVNRLITANNLPRDLGHMYLLFLPKHAESCFYAGNPSNQACTINPSPSAAYCAYHSSFDPNGTSIYAMMPFPVYNSPVGYSCTDETIDGVNHTIQAPNGDPDADVEVSPLSHEMAEAITDPNGDAWWDAVGYENGDDCAYIYGTLSGSNGGYYNQVVNGRHYLTQEEFSNLDFAQTGDGCLQDVDPSMPAVVSVSPGSGAAGTSVTITGTGFAGATGVTFGSTAANFTVQDSSHIAATAPPGSGTVDVHVTTGAGSSPTVPTDTYSYPVPAPTVTKVSPARGPASGGQTVTVTGSALTGATQVLFGNKAGSHVQVVSAGKLTVVAPAHAVGSVDVRVKTAGGTSAISSHDKYAYEPRPTVTSVSPAKGTKAGGTLVTIKGTGFISGAKVHFGSAAGTSVTVVSSTKITVRTPAHAKGTVDVTVKTAGGTSATGSADHYTFT